MPNHKDHATIAQAMAIAAAQNLDIQEIEESAREFMIYPQEFYDWELIREYLAEFLICELAIADWVINERLELTIKNLVRYDAPLSKAN